MSEPNHEPPSLEDILYVLNHVFLPPRLPQEDDSDPNRDFYLCRLVYEASLQFCRFITNSQRPQWSIVIGMLKTLLETTSSPILDQSVVIERILHLQVGDVLVLQIHSQNAALIIRKRLRSMTFEAFEISPSPESVMSLQGKLICSYPGPAIDLPLNIAEARSFVEQLVSFLAHMDVDRLDAEATTTKAGSKVPESRGTTHPRYITQLLAMILRGMGSEATVNRITKRIADEACWMDAEKPWRRSPFWLVLRVAIQTTADSHIYKSFMVFFRVHLLELFLAHDLSSELLHIARIKTAERVHKLSEDASPKLLKRVEAIGKEIGQRLQERWSDEQRQQAISPSYQPDLSAFEFERETTMSLDNSRSYLTRIMCAAHDSGTVNEFAPEHFPRLTSLSDFHLFRPNGLTEAVRADPYVALADFEFIVQERLDGWVEINQDKSACETLGSCLEQYISAAQKHYSSTPESQSIMILTIMELWLALDTIAVIQIPLLSSYSPEIPASFLDPLLLRRAKSIVRAGQIQLYLRARHDNATVSTSVYSDQLADTTFSVRYFRQTPMLQHAKASIERSAEISRKEKRAELGRMNAKHSSLTKEAANLSCSYGFWGQHMWRICHKCFTRRTADDLRIQVHEWPLPRRYLEAEWEAESIVFELNCPPVFAIWRTRTYQILRDIGMTHINVQSEFSPHILLEEYDAFPTNSVPSGRITLGSETKSFLNSHYRELRLPTEDDIVCVENGLRFRLYDTMKGEGMPRSFKLNLDSFCTLRLPEDGDGLYKHLQYAVTHTTHTHNGTIADQEDCPKNLTIHEQLAFSNLRCGSRLQWMNIVRELRTNVLTFSREEVHTLITQAAWQIGPLWKDGKVREWHFELELSDFGLVLIREAMDLLERVEANWMEGTTVKTIIYLTSRLLTSTSDSQQEVRQRGYELLRKARLVTHKWMREILERLKAAVGDSDIDELHRQACEIAATCRATFDVDPDIHLDALLSSSDDLAVLIECTIAVHDNTPPHLGPTLKDFQKLLHRDCRLSHVIESTVFKRIDADHGAGLNEAIRSVWPQYCPGAAWTQLKEPNARWMTTYTAPLHPKCAQQVHYNILNGKLLVDGKPLGRLPDGIVGHPTYKRIFGKKILHVIPADMPGMEYATRSKVHDYEVFFALRDKNLCIRAITPSNQLLELVPHKVFMKDFPTLLSRDYTHWMDVKTGEIEFRPLDRLWEQSSENWRLLFSAGLPSKMIHGTSNKCLIDIRSATFLGIADHIHPLESSDYIHMTTVFDVQTATRSIWIELPRFRLSFFVNDFGQLESKNMQGMVIDANQSSGTMIGLKSQLVLRHKEPISASLPRSRCVLIPHGNIRVSLSPNRHHVRLDIDTRATFTPQVTWYKYEIDLDLGLLVGNVSLTSRLYRIYLHALCSHVLPDPLTNQTGTDHALQELGAAGCFSFQMLTEPDVELLRLIAKLTPLRRYYPKHLRVMQTTEWSHLPALSQHGAFDTTVHSILKHAQSLTIFSEPKNGDLDYKSEGNPFLKERAMWRNAIYYEGGVHIVPPDIDGRYNSRDSPHLPEHDSDGIAALNIARLVYAWPVGLTRRLGSSELLDAFKQWGVIRGPSQKLSLIYSKEWLSKEWLNVDLPAKWISIYDQIRGSFVKKLELVFSFAALAYSNPSVRPLIPILLAFATIPAFTRIPPHQHLSYNLKDGFEPLRERVKGMITSLTKDLKDSPAGQRAQRSYETVGEFHVRRRAEYDNTSKLKTDNAVERLMRESNHCSPQSPFQTDDDSWFETREIMKGVEEYFSSCSRNRDLRSFISEVTVILQGNYIDFPLIFVESPIFGFEAESDAGHGQRRRLSSTLEYLLSSRAPPQDRLTHKFGHVSTSNVKKLNSQFQNTRNAVLTKLYGERLENSRSELDNQKISIFPDGTGAYGNQCRVRLKDIFLSMQSALDPVTTAERILADAGLWPRIHPRTLLHSLASTANIPLTPEWTECLIKFAEIFMEYQYSQRLVAYALHEQTDNFLKEVDNASFNESDAMKYPDWLLIQIQGNFIARAVQSNVAREMITPSSGTNTVLQLNMGEGKSHVIVPLVAVALADSHKLVRVVVLKPLAGQMFDLLVERISGLVNRRIFYLPFSRDVRMTPQQVQHIRDLFEHCARVQGVLVAQPEHILSFRLMVIERILHSGSPLDDVAQKLNETQKWLTSTSRDILDESDELLHVRYQLIYTMGEQRPLDYGPTRWITVQNILTLVRRHAEGLYHEFPEHVELLGHCGEGGRFPHVRLLGTPAADSLVSRIAKDTLDGKLDNLPLVGLSTQPALHSPVLRFITKRGLDHETFLTVKAAYGQTDFWKGLLLVRGLLAQGILIYVLSQQRWRVDYGLDLKRSLYAVPYRAKDMPSLRSEFGHPDVAVCLTCLSYYYGGLTCSQVRECFDLLFRLDNPALEYGKWVERGGKDIPKLLRRLEGLNTKDPETFTTHIPIFRNNQAVVDFFLSRVVFPKEAKEFPEKLGTSAWDLVEEKFNPTTGFSGTNDNSDLLPTSITQSDPVNQLRTNAQVLEYLLQPENEEYMCIDKNGRRCSAKEFLELLPDKDINVLLDVGAQLLEMTNEQLIKHWLSLRKEVAAGVFFDDTDRLSVRSQDGVVEPLHSSPFLRQLDRCIIFLDDAHTRGTDLKLPSNFRAAVTLGPKVTKDRLVQGCMRMRKLGHGQSVKFFAPAEVDRQIRSIRNSGIAVLSDPVKVADVLTWAMFRTCSDIEHHIPHWVQQGIDHQQRRNGEIAFSCNPDVEILKHAWLQPAAQSLEEMYGISNSSNNPIDNVPNHMRERLEKLGVTTVRDAGMEEEQEREVSHELEQELQQEGPPKLEPAIHHLDEEVVRFVRYGTISAKPVFHPLASPKSTVFLPLMRPFLWKSKWLDHPKEWSTRLLCTRDFATTTREGREETHITHYLRPVNWIVSCVPKGGEMILVVMSPFEVNHLLEKIRASKYVHLHMYAPRTTKVTKPFDDLRFYCVPPIPLGSTAWIPPSLDVRCQLNIWAGQLYLDSYETYLRLCLLLGISCSEEAGYSSVENDRFVPESGRDEEMRGVCLFKASPLSLVKTLFGFRRKGMSYDLTHMGKILRARVLSQEDFKEEDFTEEEEEEAEEDSETLIRPRGYLDYESPDSSG